MCSVILNSQNNKDLPRRPTVSENVLRRKAGVAVYEGDTELDKVAVMTMN